MDYCNICGTRLELRECEGEPELIPFCPSCGEYRFEQFNVAIITAIFNTDRSKLFMMRQYGREKFNFLAGYVNKGESAEEALRREMQEEMGMTLVSHKMLFTYYFAKSSTLMIAFESTVDSEDLSGMNEREVDEARWFCSYDEAWEAVIKGAVAEKLLKLLTLNYQLSTLNS